MLRKRSSKNCLPSQSGDATPAITGNLTSGDLYVFWNNEAQMRLKRRVGGVWKASMDLASPTSVTSNSHSVSAYLHVYSGKIGCIWLEGSSSPYTVKHALNPAVQLDSTTYMHGKRSWYVQGSQSQDIFIEQALSSEVVEYIRNRKQNQQRGVCFSFWYNITDVVPDGTKNKARAEIDYYDGSWHTVANSTVMPVNAKWHVAQVNARLLPTTTQVKVRIRGYYYSATGEGFKAWIDQASLSVYYYNTTIGTQGNVTLITNIYYSNAISGQPSWDGFVAAGAGVFASAKNDHTVYKIKELRVELLPNNASATTQAGRLLILYFMQTNNKSIIIDPAAQEESVNSAIDTTLLVLSIAGFTFGVITGGASVVAAYYAVPIVWKIQAILFGIRTTLGAAPYFVQAGRVELYDPVAIGDSDYFVKADVDYTKAHSFNTLNDRIGWADAGYYFDWRFRTDSDDVFAIKISATVEWYKWYDPTPVPGDEYWGYAGQTTVSTIISIANYWQ